MAKDDRPLQDFGIIYSIIINFYCALEDELQRSRNGLRQLPTLRRCNLSLSSLFSILLYQHAPAPAHSATRCPIPPSPSLTQSSRRQRGETLRRSHSPASSRQFRTLAPSSRLCLLAPLRPLRASTPPNLSSRCRAIAPACPRCAVAPISPVSRAPSSCPPRALSGPSRPFPIAPFSRCCAIAPVAPVFALSCPRTPVAPFSRPRTLAPSSHHRARTPLSHHHARAPQFTRLSPALVPSSLRPLWDVVPAPPRPLAPSSRCCAGMRSSRRRPGLALFAPSCPRTLTPSPRRNLVPSSRHRVVVLTPLSRWHAVVALLRRHAVIASSPRSRPLRAVMPAHPRALALSQPRALVAPSRHRAHAVVTLARRRRAVAVMGAGEMG
ncbi:hypothetical protein DENSPDRAFT_887094 [Dentipellis sp. KUC8613]|nr:hypothetical protein DENSPDRAFT_887094 [Dentipellis sp. KUC8613]